MKFKIVFAVLFITSASLFAEETQTLQVGNSLPEIVYTDQFEKENPIPLGTTKVLFIADMDASKILHPILEKEGAGYLEKNKTVLISDIHRMPFLISKFVALPKMKGYPYTIRLVREEKLADPFPRTKGFVTLIVLEAGKVKTISQSNSESEIREFISK